jgi:hypothetical protein
MDIKKNIALSSFTLLGLIGGFLLSSCCIGGINTYDAVYAKNTVTVSVPTQNTYKVGETLAIDFFIKRKIPQQVYHCEQGEANMAFEIDLAKDELDSTNHLADKSYIIMQNYEFLWLGYIQQPADTSWIQFSSIYTHSFAYPIEVEYPSHRLPYNSILDNFNAQFKFTFKQKGHYVLRTFSDILIFFPNFLIFDGDSHSACKKNNKPKRCELGSFKIPLGELSKLDRDIFVD